MDEYIYANRAKFGVTFISSGSFKQFFDMSVLSSQIPVGEHNSPLGYIYFIYMDNTRNVSSNDDVVEELKLYRAFSAAGLSPRIYGGFVLKPPQVTLEFVDLDLMIYQLSFGTISVGQVIFVMDKFICAENIIRRFQRPRNPSTSSTCIDYVNILYRARILIDRITDAGYFNSDFKLDNTCISNGDLLAIDLDPSFIKNISLYTIAPPGFAVPMFRIYMMLQFYISLSIYHLQYEHCYIPLEYTGYTDTEYNIMLSSIKQFHNHYVEVNNGDPLGSPYEMLLYYHNFLMDIIHSPLLLRDGQEENVDNYRIKRYPLSCGCDRTATPDPRAAAEPGYFGGSLVKKFYKKSIRKNKKSKKTYKKRKISEFVLLKFE